MDTEKMDVDLNVDTAETPQHAVTSTLKPPEEHGSAKGVSFSKPETPMKPDDLYPIFWSLQRSFSQPKTLSSQTDLVGFKAGLQATVVMFKSVQNERPTKKEDENKRGTKRKRSQGDDDLANAFNPKYLTSRDLFELEV